MPSFYVYLLYSESRRRTYVGQTADVDARLSQHNAGKVKSTRWGRPWVVVHTDEYCSREEAKQHEAYLKTASGRKHITLLLAEKGLDQRESR